MYPQEFMCWKIGHQCVELKVPENLGRGVVRTPGVLSREGINAGQAGKFPSEEIIVPFQHSVFLLHIPHHRDAIYHGNTMQIEQGLVPEL